MLNDVTITRIKEDSCLNVLEYFHVTENVGVDIMYDACARRCWAFGG